MLILSIDSAASACSVCVWRDGQILAQASEQMLRGQDARLMPMIVAAIAQAGIGFADLDRIAVTRGPGSFTGLRVGLAAARGVGLAASKPVIGIDRFAIYRALNPIGAVLVIIESKRAELFCRFFPALGAAHEACLMTQMQIDDFTAAHPGIIRTGDIDAPYAQTTAACAMLAAQADPAHPDHLPRPLYLRNADVSFPKESKAR